MPEQQPAPLAPLGGYPPMPTMAWSTPGWPANGALTPVISPDAARLTLRAESETSVLDPVGMRRLWVREAAVGVALGIFVLAVVASVQFFHSGELPAWWFLFMLMVLIGNVGVMFKSALWRAVPGPGVMPRLGPARWRWYRSLWREPVPAPSPPAAWPPGSEAYALLSGAASVESVALGWLCERVGMSPTVGAQWVTVLSRQGWLTGGGYPLGISRLPEEQVVATDAGRERLARERARLERLASGLTTTTRRTRCCSGHPTDDLAKSGALR